MSYIAPNSVVQFMPALGNTPDYNDTFYFGTTAAKDAYFSGKVILTLDNYSYIRKTQNTIRVEASQSALLNIGYLRFKNTSFVDKWFYAFVTNTEYINNEVTEITFELDYIMTWMGTFTLGTCYVERQHVQNDAIGANIADEGIQCGSYINEFIDRFEGAQEEYMITVLYADDEGHGGGLNGGIYSGCSTHHFAGPESANGYLKTVGTADKSKIVSIFMSPGAIASHDYENEGAVYMATYQGAKPYASLNGYVPRNNKLFVYPFKYLEVDNMEGVHGEYHYEFFGALPPGNDPGAFTFTKVGAISGRPQLLAIPMYYKGATEEDGFNWSEAIPQSHFPSCAYAIDSYEAYLAQSNSNLPLTLGQSAIKGALSGGTVGMAGGTPVSVAGGAAVGAVTNVLGVATSALMQNLFKPDQGVEMKGVQDTDIAVAMQKKDYVFYGKCITENYANMIDDYFTAFGYAVRQFLVPNMCTRQNFTYVKTAGAIVRGSLPADHAGRIASILNNGVRFWRSPDKIGDLSVDNSPLT